jgi:hypothetical protein
MEICIICNNQTENRRGMSNHYRNKHSTVSKKDRREI